MAKKEETVSLLDTFQEFKESKNIDRTTMISVLEESFRKVLVNMFGTDENYSVIVNPDRGDFEIQRRRTVVEDKDVKDSNFEIGLTEAQLIDDTFEVGEEVSEIVNFAEFGRRAILNLRQTLASKIYALLLGGAGHDVEGRSTVLADPAPGHALLDDRILDLDGQHMVQMNTAVIQGLGLGQRAGHAVQDVAVGAVGLRDPLCHNADDQLVGHQMTGVHAGLDLKAQRSLVLDGSAENVTGRDGRDTQLGAEDLSLRSFAGARSA